MRGRVVEQIECDRAGEPEPADVVLYSNVRAAQSVECLLERDGASHVTLCEADSHTGEQQITGVGRVLLAYHAVRGMGCTPKHLSAETARNLPCSHGLQVRMPGDSGLDHFQATRGRHKCRHGLTDVHLIEGDLTFEALRESALALIERSMKCRR